jgi:hypothetical protein
MNKAFGTLLANEIAKLMKETTAKARTRSIGSQGSHKLSDDGHKSDDVLKPDFKNVEDDPFDDDDIDDFYDDSF